MLFHFEEIIKKKYQHSLKPIHMCFVKNTYTIKENYSEITSDYFFMFKEI